MKCTWQKELQCKGSSRGPRQCCRGKGEGPPPSKQLPGQEVGQGLATLSTFQDVRAKGSFPKLVPQPPH